MINFNFKRTKEVGLGVVYSPHKLQIYLIFFDIEILWPEKQ